MYFSSDGISEALLYRIRVQKQNINSSIRLVQKPKNILYVLEICKKSEYLKFSDYIYSNFSNSLTRKKDKFNEVKIKNNETIIYSNGEELNEEDLQSKET